MTETGNKERITDEGWGESASGLSHEAACSLPRPRVEGSASGIAVKCAIDVHPGWLFQANAWFWTYREDPRINPRAVFNDKDALAQPSGSANRFRLPFAQSPVPRRLLAIWLCNSPVFFVVENRYDQGSEQGSESEESNPQKDCQSLAT